MKLYRYLNFLLNIFLLAAPAFAQVPEVRVEVGETELTSGQPFEIKVVVRNPQDRSEVLFPKLRGLEKGSSTRLRSSAGTEENQVPQEVIVQQYFFPTGYLEVPASEVTVNGSRYAVPALVLRTKEDRKDSVSARELEALQDLDDQLSDHLEKEDVFLTVRPSKGSVYLREGFGLYLSLFVAKDVRLSMEFYDLDNQLKEITRQLKPDGCWEENTWIDEIVPRPITLRGRDYTEYRLYQSVFFPFIRKNVSFPAISLKMNMGENGAAVRTFYSRALSVEVRNLPPHPRRDVVAVGSYELAESLSATAVGVGQPFRYKFGISGQGNIAAIPAPATIPVQTFEFYPPEVNQTLKADLRTVSGTKTFEYTLVPRQKGLFPLKGYFQWIFFDPGREVYDTLRSGRTIEVSGAGGAVAESVVPIGENRLYANLEQLDSQAAQRNYSGIFRIVMNVVVILMLLSVLWVFRK